MNLHVTLIIYTHWCRPLQVWLALCTLKTEESVSPWCERGSTSSQVSANEASAHKRQSVSGEMTFQK